MFHLSSNDRIFRDGAVLCNVAIGSTHTLEPVGQVTVRSLFNHLHVGSITSSGKTPLSSHSNNMFWQGPIQHALKLPEQLEIVVPDIV